MYRDCSAGVGGLGGGGGGGSRGAGRGGLLSSELINIIRTDKTSVILVVFCIQKPLVLSVH